MIKNFPYTIDTLSFTFEALEPVIDQLTMQIHHDKHHQAYCDNLNKLVGEKSDLQGQTLQELLLVDDQSIKNNAGGVWNHDFFWSVLATPNSSQMSDELKKQIEISFGNIAEFMTLFEKSALGRFGSGWVWLVKGDDGTLEIISTPNQDNPLMHGKKPVLGLDVWEHAYYLKYQNKRVDYVKAFWQIVNWAKVGELLNAS